MSCALAHCISTSDGSLSLTHTLYEAGRLNSLQGWEMSQQKYGCQYLGINNSSHAWSLYPKPSRVMDFGRERYMLLTQLLTPWPSFKGRSLRISFRADSIISQQGIEAVGHWVSLLLMRSRVNVYWLFASLFVLLVFPYYIGSQASAVSGGVADTHMVTEK